MGTIKKLRFSQQGNKRTRRYIRELRKLFKGSDYGSAFNGCLKKLGKIEKDLQFGSVKFDDVAIKQIRANINRLERSLPEDDELLMSLEAETSKICGKIRARKNYHRTTKKEVTRVQLYPETKQRLIDLYDCLAGVGEDVKWPERMEFLLEYFEEKLDS